MNAIRTVALLAEGRHWGPASEPGVKGDGRQQTLGLVGALALSNFPTGFCLGRGVQVSGAAAV